MPLRASLRLARGPDAPSGESPPRSRDPNPQRISASLEAALDPRHRTYSPNQRIKCSGTPRALGSKANSHHADPLTPPRNRITMLFNQPASHDHPQRYAETVWEGRCHSTTLCLPLPYLLHIAPLERGRWHPQKGYDHLPHASLGWRHDVRPAERVSPLCRHPQHCAAIPSTTASSPALWEPKSMGHSHAGRCAAYGLPSVEPSNRHTDGDQTRVPALLPLKPPLDGHKIRHDAHRRQDLPGQQSILRHYAPCRYM
jgi:hypothetical protein